MSTGVWAQNQNRGIGGVDVIQPFIQPGRRRKETKDWGHLSLWFKMMPEMWCLQHVKVPKNGGNYCNYQMFSQWPCNRKPIDWRYRFHIFLAYFLGLCKGIYPPKYGQKYGTNVPPCIGSWRSPIEEMFCAFNMFQHVSTKIVIFFRIWKTIFEMGDALNMPQLKSL